MTGSAPLPLNSTRRDILYLVAANPDATGQEISRQLGKAEGESINNGRLYPALDDLVDADFVEKIVPDDRENSYRITREGQRALEMDLDWRVDLYEKSLRD